MKGFIDFIAVLMALVFVFCVSTVVYQRIVNGPPCHYVADHKYVCNL